LLYFIDLSWCLQKVLLVILNAVVDVDADAVAIVVLDVAAVIVDVAALIAVADVAAVIVDVVALTAAAGVAALIVAADAGDPVVLLLAVAPAPFVAGERLLSLVPSLLLRMSEPSASNVQDMGPPGGWSRSSPIISRPIWIRGSSTITTVCASLPTRKDALNRSSLVLPRVVGKHDPSHICALLITTYHSHFTRQAASSGPQFRDNQHVTN
jgi:hypothetical protein